MLDELPIAEAILMPVFWQHNSIILIAIRIDFQLILVGGLLDCIVQLAHEEPARILIPCPDRITNKKEGYSLYTGENCSFAFKRVGILTVFFALLFFIKLNSSSTS